jgi:hypothetical protein
MNSEILIYNTIETIPTPLPDSIEKLNSYFKNKTIIALDIRLLIFPKNLKKLKTIFNNFQTLKITNIEIDHKKLDYESLKTIFRNFKTIKYIRLKYCNI